MTEENKEIRSGLSNVRSLRLSFSLPVYCYDMYKKCINIHTCVWRFRECRETACCLLSVWTTRTSSSVIAAYSIETHTRKEWRISGNHIEEAVSWLQCDIYVWMFTYNVRAGVYRAVLVCLFFPFLFRGWLSKRWDTQLRRQQQHQQQWCV